MSNLNNLYTKIGELVRARREDAGLTQDGLGERLGMTRTSITNIENARQRVQIDKLYELAEVLGIPVSSLLPPEFVGEQANIPTEYLKGLPPAVRAWLQEMIVVPTSRVSPPAALEKLERLRNFIASGGMEMGVERGMEYMGIEARELSGETGIPVSAEKVARGLGVDVRYGPCQADVAATIYSQGIVIIAVNALQMALRQRFAVAHALGHLLLQDKAFHVDKGFSSADEDEVAANLFAAHLLVPGPELLRDLEGRSLDFEDDGAVRELAEKYRVSVQVMARRITSTHNNF